MFAISFPFQKSPQYPLSLQKYLKRLKWNTKHFTNKELEGKLTSIMYKYLSGKITDIHIILGLSEEIRKKQGKRMHLELSSMTTLLHHLSQKIHKKEIDPEDTKMLHMIINRIQQIATRKSFLN